MAPPHQTTLEVHHARAPCQARARCWNLSLKHPAEREKKQELKHPQKKKKEVLHREGREKKKGPGGATDQGWKSGRRAEGQQKRPGEGGDGGQKDGQPRIVSMKQRRRLQGLARCSTTTTQPAYTGRCVSWLASWRRSLKAMCRSCRPCCAATSSHTISPPRLANDMPLAGRSTHSTYSITPLVERRVRIFTLSVDSHFDRFPHCKGFVTSWMPIWVSLL